MQEKTPLDNRKKAGIGFIAAPVVIFIVLSLFTGDGTNTLVNNSMFAVLGFGIIPVIAGIVLLVSKKKED